MNFQLEDVGEIKRLHIGVSGLESGVGWHLREVKLRKERDTHVRIYVTQVYLHVIHACIYTINVLIHVHVNIPLMCFIIQQTILQYVFKCDQWLSSGHDMHKFVRILEPEKRKKLANMRGVHLGHREFLYVPII